ncbi:MAG: hypothetical protein A3K19_33055 [Lentisphaerae bacterium RIFOXYB12_FULL_65_16]|nr:MAG: hypothetical protein A3K18_31690 [Lentisphaerae bacterium RIFOXYA12_64_32]OGV87016.1 MAG: hypothetical protein A3K19_33055 [Lentisphaerae bacterium RIFOXYB12_FULL_65_16]
MWHTVQRLALGTILIALASAVLLLADRRSTPRATRPGNSKVAPPRVVQTIPLFQFNSSSILDDTAAGVIDGLAERGYRNGEQIRILRLNAESDLPTANTIAKQITDGSYPLVITVSTLCLQVVAHANKDGRAVHVFGAVTDPAGAGVGIQRMDSTEKPRHLAGMGTFQPVARAFHAARDLWPDLKVVGTAWNPTEANSQACVIRGRAICAELGITLLEANIESSRDVMEAGDSLTARGAQALWTGGDVTVQNAFESLVQAARKARVPVFTNTCGLVRKGALLDVGASYTEVGKAVGLMAADILGGADPATIPVHDRMPEQIQLNHQTLKGLRDPWTFPPKYVSRAGLIIEEDGSVRTNVKPEAQAPVVPQPPAPLAKTWRLQLVQYNESPGAEESLRGFMVGLKEAGLVDGRDFTLRRRSAQGDMATLPGVLDAAQAEGGDLFVILSTPTLQVAIQKIKDTPLVFTFVANPFVIGAGKTDTDHLPNVTGVYTIGAYRDMAVLLKTHFPQFTRVGTLFCPAEINSIHNKDKVLEELEKQGITLDAIPVSTASEFPDAALALCSRNIDAVVQIIDNITDSSFVSLGNCAKRAKLPVFCFTTNALHQGGMICVARDYVDIGRETAQKAALIMRGRSPADIPFAPPQRVRRMINLENAQAVGLQIPEALLRELEVLQPTTPKP